MAEAMVGGMMAENLQPVQDTHVYDVNERRMDLYQKRWPGLQTHQSARACVEGADLVLLSVKPQQMEALLQEISPVVPRSSLVVSIAAGCPVEMFTEALDTASIVRSMPNTPAMVGAGMTVWMPTPECTEPQRQQAQRLLSCMGQELCVAEEHFLDVATAVSGTGPAYVFMLIEAMIDTGVHMGFSREVANKIVVQTVEGATAYLKQSDKHIAELRNDITSPGGTTAAAIYTSDQGRLRTTIADSIWSAYRRSLELGGKDSNVGPGRFSLTRAAKPLTNGNGK